MAAVAVEGHALPSDDGEHDSRRSVKRGHGGAPGGIARRVGLVAMTAMLVAVLWAPGDAQALSGVIKAHMPEIVEWVYRNGGVETAHTCEATCSKLWEGEASTPPGSQALGGLRDLESGIPLWGTATEMRRAINAATRNLGSTPLRVGWRVVDGGAPGASKWIELSGPANPGCGSEAHVVLEGPGEEIGGTFYEHAYSPGEDWYLACSGTTGQIVAQQVRAPINGKGCEELGGPPSYAGFVRQEWWWNKCYEGGETLSNVTAFAYHSPLRVVKVEAWKGQHLEGEAAFNIETYAGTDPGTGAVTEQTEAELERNSWLREWVEWALGGKSGPNPGGAAAGESYGPGSGPEPTGSGSTTPAPGELGCHEAKPVDCATGNETTTQWDLAVGGRGPGLDLTRTYNSQLAASQTSPGPFGYGWTASYSAHIEVSAERGSATVYEDDGRSVRFAKAGSMWVAVNPLVEATLGGEGTSYLYTLPNQTQLRFNSSGQLTSESYRKSNTLTMTRGEGGRLEAITDAAGRKITLAYNGEGLVESAKDPMGHVVKYSYESGKLASVTLPGETSARWQFKYDASHELTSETDGRGHSITNEYDGEHRVVFQSDALGRQRKWSYEGSASAPKTTIIEPNGSKTVEEFNERGEPTSVTRAAGTSLASTTIYAYDEAGRLDRLTDPDGHATTYGYDAAGDRTGEVDALGETRSWSYDSTHDVEAETTPKGETTTIERDAHGNPTKVSRPAPGGGFQITKYKYGAHGELESVTDPLERTTKYEYDSYGDRAAEIDPEGDKRTWKYNEDSQVVSVVSPRGHVSGAKEASFTTAIERDAQGRVLKITDPLKHVTKYAYDANGNLESQTDPEGNLTSYTYDADNEPTKVKEPNGTTTETEYDSEGQLVAQVDGNKHTTKYKRNALGEVEEVLDPLGHKTLKEYDVAGNLTKLTDAAKRTTTYTYDPANRLTEVSYSDGVTPTVKYEYDADGDRVKMVDGTGTSKYVYDQLDRLTESKDGHGDVVGYEYDLANEQTKITYPNGKSVARAFDKDGRLESVTDWLGHTSKFGYDADSDQTSTTFPSSTTDVDQYAYEDDDAMEAVTMKKATEVLASSEYSRNKDSQVTKATTKGLPGEEKPAFSYDENGRLSKGAGVKYAYDAANNPTTLGSDTYAYNSADEPESATYKKEVVATYAYDELGERTKTTPSSGTATTYGYDQAGNITAVTRPKAGETPAIADNYGYNGAALRTSQTIGATTSYLAWAEGEAVPLLLSDEARSFIYGPGGLPIEQITGETVLYLHHDQQGSTRMLTGATGASEGTATYDGYGNRLGTTGSASTPLGYDAQYTSGDTGLIYMRARTYDPATAQFLSVDPLKAISGEPYGYTRDNPVTYGDAVGLLSVPVAGGVGGADVACGATFEVPGVDIGTCGAAGIGTGVAAVGAAVGVVTAIAGDEGGDEGEAFLQQRQAEEAAGENEQGCGNTPPGYDSESWTKGPASRPSDPGENYYDPDGGEWRWHGPDKYHPGDGGHWDYKGPGNSAPWQNVYP